LMFRVVIPKAFWVMLWTKLAWKITNVSNWIIMHGSVIILVRCTPPQYDLSTYQVLSWYLKYLLIYDPYKNVGRIDDGRMDGRTKTISLSPPPFRQGIKLFQIKSKVKAKKILY
jgi:hypothetical protein